MKRVIIQGSSKSEGNTHKLVKYLMDQGEFDFIDLKDKKIGPFDYDFKYAEDDFLPLIRKIVDEYDSLIFATPVYWYSMSGIMKNFFDRLSDCLHYEKETGRKLRGKSMAMISCSGEDDRLASFADPFKASADYLGMKYLGDVHGYVQGGEFEEVVKGRLDGLIKLCSS